MSLRDQEELSEVNARVLQLVYLRCHRADCRFHSGMKFSACSLKRIVIDGVGTCANYERSGA